MAVPLLRIIEASSLTDISHRLIQLCIAQPRHNAVERRDGALHGLVAILKFVNGRNLPLPEGPLGVTASFSALLRHLSKVERLFPSGYSYLQLIVGW